MILGAMQVEKLGFHFIPTFGSKAMTFCGIVATLVSVIGISGGIPLEVYAQKGLCVYSCNKLVVSNKFEERVSQFVIYLRGLQRCLQVHCSG